MHRKTKVTKNIFAFPIFLVLIITMFTLEVKIDHPKFLLQNLYVDNMLKYLSIFLGNNFKFS